jgi:hypothetical protein
MKRLITKADRLNSQNAQFEILIEKGFARTNYKGLHIFTKTENGFLLKIFRDTLTNSIHWVRYHNEESRNEAIEQQKKYYDQRIEWQEKRKALRSNPENSCSGSIKKELQENFPGVKFSVTSGGADSVRVRWTDGPTSNQVEEFTSKYQRGHFNGMEDIYEYSNRRNDIPQTNYVFESRDMSAEVREVLTREAQKLIDAGHDYSHAGCHDAGNFAYRLYQDCPIPMGAKVIGIEPNGVTCGTSDPRTFFRVVVELPEGKGNQAKTAQTNYEKVEAKAGEIHVVDYSEKAFAVIGDTKPIKDILSDLHGTWNPRLTCGPGWIFSKKRLQSVQDKLTQISEERKQKPFMALLPPAKATEVREEWNKMDNFLNNLSA